jgi:hypothetical protein
MKTVIHIWFSRLFLILGAGLTLTGCEDLQSVQIPESNGIAGTGALYILCDGNYSLNNSNLALYDFTKGSLSKDFFQENSGRKLGDTGNDLKRYGSKIYIVVNGSSQLEVLDARTGSSLKRIPLFNGSVARQPRYVAFWSDKAYVCCFDGAIVRVDTASLTADGVMQAGRNPDGITASNGKLYVSNSGGLDYNSNVGYDHTVSVVSTDNFTELKKVEVGLNPGYIEADNYGYVYVSVRGDYADVSGKWVCINTQNDEVAATYDFPVTRFELAGEKAYFYSWDEETGESQIGVFNLRDKVLETNSFITDGTKIQTPYGVRVDPESGSVFITDAVDFVSSGDVLCFSTAGKLMYRISNVGVSPNNVLAVSDFESGTSNTDTTVSLIGDGIESVLDFTPAPGQFVGLYPPFAEGDTKESMRIKAQNRIKGSTGEIVSLGRYGGSLTFAFHDAVNNREGMDFQVYGNAFTNSAEPGIVEVSEDVNQNGLPDDPWYELAGSEYSTSGTLHGYTIVYYKPASTDDQVFWRDNQGSTGYADPRYPMCESDSIVCTGSRLPSTAIQNQTGFWLLNNLPWGYADNQPNSSELSGMDLDWAVDASGNHVDLQRIDFVRVYTGVNQDMGSLGELSTEITGALNLHP